MTLLDHIAHEHHELCAHHEAKPCDCGTEAARRSLRKEVDVMR